VIIVPLARSAKDGLPWARRVLRGLVAVVFAVVLASCSTDIGSLGGMFESSPDGSDQPHINAMQQGGIKVAMLLPLSAAGQAGAIARSLKEAGELALFDTPNPGVVLVPKDTRGSPDGARLAANQAIQEGARLIIGPLFAGSVRAAGAIARASSVPVVAFSTDRNVAGGGVFLLSFLPALDVDRIVSYAVSRKKKNFAALIPKSAYGTLVENALANSLAQHGGKLVAVQRYNRSEQGLVEPVRRIATTIKQRRNKVQVLLVPESGQLLRSFATQFAAQKIPKGRVQLAGTGLWDDASVGSNKALVGGWFAAPPPQSKAAFAQRYQKAYGRNPPRIASLAYDAVSLAIALSRTPAAPGQSPFSSASLTNADGFAGVDGLFRFKPDGLNQRGLAVMEVTPGGARILSAAPNRFGAGAGF